MPEKELQFLKDSNAYFITKDGMNTVVNHRNPFEVFRNTDDNSGQTMGSMLSFFSGGGPDQTAQASLISILEKLTASVPLVAQLIPTLPPMEVTNRDIEQGIDKSLQTIDQTMSLRDTLALAPPNYTKEIFKLIPDKNPKHDDILQLALMLGLTGLLPSNGIRKRSSSISNAIAARDWLDCNHIAYGLFCDAFITKDKTALRRARLIKDFWQLPSQVTDDSGINY
ncbi:MAG: hypothetical protein ACJAYH_001284 [Celeribacter sp.]|jgi:hypothetical protein